MNKEQIIDALKRRYATKQFDTSKKIDDANFDALLEVIRLSPSSFGVQPWRFIVVRNPELREKLKAAAYGQPQVTEASHLIVFAIVNNLDEAYIDSFIKSTAEVRGISATTLQPVKEMIMGSVLSKSDTDKKAWSAKQLYISLGMLLEAAALLGIDASPMEGFDPAEFDEILGLKEKGLAATVICALGYRSESDPYATYPKSRFSKNEVVIEM